MILLAAGASRRMGMIKQQLLPTEGEPALAACLKRILAGSSLEIIRCAKTAAKMAATPIIFRT